MVKLIFRKENKRINIKNKENLSSISRKKREKERERERAEVHGVHQGLQRVFQGRDN